ncbi:MAG: hypothetical protein M4579_006842 [Chaenotheca gracillima]|nr:MAG: hypothetical protein M4579_006842 [Chaenotheca gracillima]
MRVTRSRRQANEIHEDEVVANDNMPHVVADAPPVVEDRPPLTVIDANAEETPVYELLVNIPSGNGAKDKGKKEKGQKRVKKTKKATAPVQNEFCFIGAGNYPDVPETKAVAEACSRLMEPHKDDVCQELYDERPETPPSPAAEAARKELGGMNSLTVLEPIGQPTSERAVRVVSPFLRRDSDKDDTSVEDFPQYDENGSETRSEEGKRDSFVGHITTRSPAKGNNRPEDSFEAMDDLEDAIEQIDKALVTGPTPAPNTETKAKNGGLEVAGCKRPTTAMRRTQSAQKKPVIEAKPDAKKATQTRAVSRPTGTAAKAGAISKKIDTKSRQAPPPQAKSQDQVTKPQAVKAVEVPTNNKPVATPARSPTRRASVQISGARTIKSTKPPTRPNFELPGEAISRRLKEQREERRKREEEELQKKREFKAKPARKAAPPTMAVRPTASSQARVARASLAEGGPNPASGKTPTLKRQSSLQIPKRSQRPSMAATAVTSVRKPSLPSAARQPSIPAASQPSTVTGADAIHQRQRGKDLFARDRLEKTELVQARKAKEDAARRARAEAADRGRLASREWAERQKRREMSKEKANHNGRAPSPIKEAPVVV